LSFVTNCKALKVYKLSKELAKDIFELSKKISRRRTIFFNRSDSPIIQIYRLTDCRCLGEKEIWKAF